MNSLNLQDFLAGCLWFVAFLIAAPFIVCAVAGVAALWFYYSCMVIGAFAKWMEELLWK